MLEVGGVKPKAPQPGSRVPSSTSSRPHPHRTHARTTDQWREIVWWLSRFEDFVLLLLLLLLTRVSRSPEYMDMLFCSFLLFDSFCYLQLSLFDSFYYLTVLLLCCSFCYLAVFVILQFVCDFGSLCYLAAFLLLLADFVIWQLLSFVSFCYLTAFVI